MKKLLIIISALFSLSAIFPADSGWKDKISQMKTDEIYKEAKAQEQSLKSDGNNPETLVKIAVCYFVLAEKGQQTAGKSVQYFEKSLKIKQDPYYQAFLGAAYNLTAKEKKDLNLLNKGFKMMDEAYEKDPGNIAIMLIRISSVVSKNLPNFIFRNRESLILKDFNNLEVMFNNKKINERTYVRVLYLKSLYFLKKENLKDSIKIWNDITSKYPDSEWAAESKEYLSLYNKY